MDKDGRIDILESLFKGNSAFFFGNDESGIVNLGGHIQCDVTGCLQVCNACGDHPVPSAKPSSSPTSMPSESLYPTVSLAPTPKPTLPPPTPLPTAGGRGETEGWPTAPWPVAGLALGCLAGLAVLSGAMVAWRRRGLRGGRRGWGLGGSNGGTAGLARYQVSRDDVSHQDCLPS